jgi:hypothetical protein
MIKAGYTGYLLRNLGDEVYIALFFEFYFQAEVFTLYVLILIVIYL